MKILSIDPGDTTGYVYADLTNNKIKTISKGEFRFPDGTLKTLLLAARKDDAVVVVEDFIIRKPLIGNKAIAIQIIGVIRFVFEDFVVLQQPAEKQRCPDSLLKKMELWNDSPHIRDAYRHIVVYLQKEKGKK